MALKSMYAAAMAAVVMLAGTATAQEKVSLKRVVKEKDIQRYKLTVKVAGSSAEMQGITMNMNLQETVEKVNTDGSSVVRINLSEFKVFMGDQDMSAMMGAITLPVITQTIAPDGKLIEVKSTGAGPEARQFTQMGQFARVTYPANPVGVGDKWTTETKETKDGGPASKSEYEVVGFERVGDTDSVKVKVRTEIMSGEQKGTVANGTLTLARATGDLVNANISSQLKNGPMGGPSTVTVTMNRLAPTAAAPATK